MLWRYVRFAIIFATFFLAECVVAKCEIPIAAIDHQGPVDFQAEILPIFRAKCLACHNQTAKKGGLVLETPALIQKGGDSGPSVVPGKATESLLLQVAAHISEPHMPPPKNPAGAEPLTPQELGLVKLWIDQGAVGEVKMVLSPQRWLPIPKNFVPVQAVGLSPDGQWVACARGSHILVYHLASGALVAQLADPSLAELAANSGSPPAHRDVVQSLAFHPQGDLLASGAFREVKLWRRPRDVRVWQVTLPTKPLALAAEPQRQWVAVGDDQGAVHVWQLGQDAPLVKIAAHQGPVRSLTFLPQPGLLVSGSEDRSLGVWQLPEGSLVARLGTPGPTRSAAVVGPLPQRENDPYLAQTENFWMASAGEDNGVWLWSLSQLPIRRVDAVRAGRQGVAAVDFQGRWLAVDGPDRQVYIVDTTTYQVVRSWQLPDEPGALGWARPASGAAPDGPPLLFVGYRTGQWTYYEAATGTARLDGRVGVTPATCWAVSADGQTFVVGGENGLCAAYRLHAEVPAIEPLGMSSVDRVAWSTDQQWVVAAGAQDNQHSTVIVDVASGRVLARRVWPEAIRAVAVHVESGRAAVALPGAVHVVNARDAGLPDIAVLGSLPAPPVGVAVSADGQRLLVAGEDHTVRLANVTGEVQWIECKGHQAKVVAALWLPNNQPVTAAADRTIRFWNAADGMQQRAVDMPEAIQTLTASSDGSRLAVATADSQIRVVETASGRQLMAMPTPWAEVTHVAFSLDSNRLLAIGRGKGAAVWELNYGQNAAVLLEQWNDAAIAGGLYGRAADHWCAWASNGQGMRQPIRFQRWIAGMNQRLVALRFHPNNQQFYSLCGDGTLRGHRLGDGATFFTTGHGSAASSIALSRDGQWLATAGEDGQVKVFQAGNGSAPGQQPAGRFSGPAVRVEFSADGSRLLAAGGGEQPEIRIWELASGMWLERMAQHARDIRVLAIGGQSVGEVISASEGEPLWVWSPHVVKVLQAAPQGVTGLATWAAAPQELVSGSREGVLRRWNVISGQQLAQLGHGSAISAVAVRPDGQRYVSAGENGTVRLWNAGNGQVLAELRGDVRLKTLVAERMRELATANARFNVAKQRAEAAEKDVPAKQEAAKKTAEALAAANKQVEEKSAQVRTTLEAKTAQERTAIELAAAAQNALMAKQRADAAAAQAAQAAQRLRERANRLTALAQSAPQDAALAKAAEEARRMADEAQARAQQAAAAQPPAQQAYEAAARAANEAAAKVAEVQKPYNEAVVALRAAEMAQNLAAQNHAVAERERQAAEAALPVARENLAAAEKAVQQAQQLLQQAQQQAGAAEQPQRAAAFSPDGQLLATGSLFPNVHLWDGQSGAALAALAGHTQPITAAAFVGTNLLATAAEDGQVAVWDTQPAWRLERTLGGVDAPELFSHRVMALDFSRDGAMLAVGGGMPSRYGSLHLFDVATGQLVRAIADAHDDTIYSVQFSPDGKRVASASADKFVKIFDVATGQMIRRLEGHTNYVLGVAWQSDGSRLASCGADRAVKIWNPDTGDQERTIEGFGKPVTVVWFIGDSDNVVSGCGDGTIRMHNAGNGGNFRNFGSAGYVHSLAISGDQQSLVAGSADGQLRLWNATNGQFLRSWPGQ